MNVFQRLSAIIRRLNPSTPTKVGEEVPTELSHLINPEEYQAILAHSLKYLSTNIALKRSFRMDKGQLTFVPKEGPGEVNLQFHQLVRHTLSYPSNQWPKAIGEYIDQLTLDRYKLAPLLASFDEAKPHLTIRVHNKQMYTPFPLKMESYVIKNPIPELYTALSIDLPERFHVLQRKELKGWDIDEDELFWTAQANLSDLWEKMEITHDVGDGFTIVSIHHQDYGAAFGVDFANNCAEWIGSIGAMVSFPSKSQVYIFPMRDTACFNKAFSKLAELTNLAYNDTHQPLSNNIYWYHRNRFELFPKNMEEDTLSYSIPFRLLAYLKTPTFRKPQGAELRDSLLSGEWEGYFEFGMGYSRPQIGTRKSFTLHLKAKGRQLEGFCMDEGAADASGVWGFVDKDLISFIKKPEEGPGVIHYTGFFEPEDASFTGTWIIEGGDGTLQSGSWSMVKL